jgi:hypothetical protein
MLGLIGEDMRFVPAWESTKRGNSCKSSVRNSEILRIDGQLELGELARCHRGHVSRVVM